MNDNQKAWQAKARKAHELFCQNHEHINITDFEQIYWSGARDGMEDVKARIETIKAVDEELRKFA